MRVALVFYVSCAVGAVALAVVIMTFPHLAPASRGGARLTGSARSPGALP